MAVLGDVAKLAGVSLATASRVLNGSSNRVVGPELTKRVMEAAQTLHYTPNTAAQAMARGRSNVIALIVGAIADPYFSTIASGVAHEARQHGHVVTIAETDGSDETSLAVVTSAVSQRARALLIAGGSTLPTPQLHQALASFRSATGSPVLTIGATDLPGINGVGIADRRGAGDLATRLLALGYRRFAVMTGPSQLRASRERAAGFTEAVATGGGTVETTVEEDFNRGGGHRGMQALLSRSPRPEVVFATADVMAVGAMTAARQAGLGVPEDIAICGFDDIPTLADITPSLTTVHIDLEELGRSAVRLALDPDHGEPPLFAAEVTIRDSTPPLTRARPV